MGWENSVHNDGNKLPKGLAIWRFFHLQCPTVLVDWGPGGNNGGDVTFYLDTGWKENKACYQMS